MEYLIWQLNQIFGKVNGFWLVLIVGSLLSVALMAILAGVIENLGHRFIRHGGRKGWWK